MRKVLITIGARAVENISHRLQPRRVDRVLVRNDPRPWPAGGEWTSPDQRINPMRRVARVRYGLAAALATVSLLAVQAPAAAGSDAAPASDAKTSSQLFAMELLTKMANYLAGLPGFEVKLVSSYDALQESGEEIEFSEMRDLKLARPDRLRVEQVRSDGFEDLVVFDGKTISVSNGEQRVYAQAPQPGALDDAIVYFVRDLGMQLPAAPMLTTRFPQELAKAVRSVDYVEYTTILPQPAHHIAGRTSSVDFQVWISDVEGQPLPRRLIITYVNQPGRPQFRAQFLEWQIRVPTDAGTFGFTPPEGARQIGFAVQVPAMIDAATAGDQGAQP